MISARTRTAAGSILAALMLAAGCSRVAAEGGDGKGPSGGGDRGANAERGLQAPPTPRVPDAPARFAPSHVKLAEGDPADVDRLTDVQACADCHPDAVRQWRSSAHAQASFNNPYYRSVVDRFRQEQGRKASRFCAGCHEPALLLSGAMQKPIEPSNPRAHAGVTCLVCHGVQQARPDGNGSYTLSTAPVPYPDPADPKSVARHRRRVAPDVLRSARLCRTCHRSVLGPDTGSPHHLPSIGDPVAWQRSAYAGSRARLLAEPVQQQRCQDCHMSSTKVQHGDMAAPDGMLASHRFAGAHRTLAQLLDDAKQEQAVRENLTGAATIDVAAAWHGTDATRPADGAPVQPGQTIELDVVVRNVGAGHRFPGGTRDIQDTWIAVRVRDAHGNTVAAAGDRHRSRDDPSAFRLRAAPVDADGQIQTTHLVNRFRAVAFDTTVPPRQARVVRYRLEVPSDLERGAFPLSIHAELLHRRHGRAMLELACRASRSERGRAFDRAARELGRDVLDGCESQPVTRIAHARVWIGAGSETKHPQGDARRPRWKRLFEHALALTRGRQEHIADAQPSIEHALKAVPPHARRARAMLMALAARVASRQGRAEQAVRWTDRAESVLGPHPALARLRGRAHARVWRWEQAADAFGVAAAGAPRDDKLWRWLARARGSAGDNRPALLAARRGLQLTPRDPGLLRSQSLALRELSSPHHPEARQAFVEHRSPDKLPALRSRCGRTQPPCQRDRQPIPTVRLRPR